MDLTQTRLEVSNGIATVTLNRPEHMNAFTPTMALELLQIFAEADRDDAVRVVVVTGAGKAFCAGADIGKFPQMLGNAAAAVEYARDCSLLLRYLDRCSKPVVAAVNGLALGGGFELALRCHQIMAAEQAWFQFPEVTLGILPGIGGMVVPYRRWPAASELFHDMIRQAKRLTAKEALDLGIVSGLAGDYLALIKLAVRAVKKMAGKPIPRIADQPVAITALASLEAPMAGKLPLSREVVEIISEAVRDAAASPSFEEALEVGYKAFGEVACTQGAREGIAAFLEKRTPQF